MATAEALPKRSDVARETTWELETIYPSDAAWEADFAKLAARLPEVRAFQGRLGESGDVLLRAIQVRDGTYELMGRLYVYAHMRLDEDSTNSTYQALNDRVSTLYNDLNTAGAYFTPEILALPADRIDAFLQATAALHTYRHVLDEIERQRAHVLSTELESLLAQAAEIGNAPERIFEMLDYADLKLPQVHDEHGTLVPLTQGNYVAKFLESRSREVRREAFEAMLGSYTGFHNTFAATLSGQVKRDVFFARARTYGSALEAALNPNNIPVAVYDNLVNTVNANLPKLHRYLTLRKQLLGLDELHMYDLYVPMVNAVDYTISYADAQAQVARAVAPLGERYVNTLRNGLASRWVDVYENAGKRSGAYSSGSYGTNPFILLNYQPTMDSMFTLAHELGHSLHSYFTRTTQPYHYGDYTIFVAEVASTLNEALMTHYLLQTTNDPGLRMYILNHALETFRGTLFRQTLFAEFERDIHAKVEAGEALTHEALSASFKALNDTYYGPVVTVDDAISIEWARIPHFYLNFYVFQYATGISASAALARQIITEGEPAVQRYLRFLSSGSSEYSIDLLRSAGVDLTSPQPIQQAIDTFADYLDQLEHLLNSKRHRNRAAPSTVQTWRERPTQGGVDTVRSPATPAPSCRDPITAHHSTPGRIVMLVMLVMRGMPSMPHGTLPPIADTPPPWQQVQTSLNQLANDPTALSIRIGLSFAVLLAALFAGRWLAELAGRAPVHFEHTLARTGRLGRRLKPTPQTSVGPWLGRLTKLSVWIAALLVLAALWFSALGTQPILTQVQIRQFVTDLAAHVGGSLLVLAATLGIARVFQRSLEKSVQHRVNPNLALLAGRLLYIAILAIGFIIILTIWDTGIVLPVTLLGALTVALSLALQDVLKNLVSGVYLLLERPFTIGDRITLAPYTGVIEDIEIRYTALRTVDGQRVIIPNSMLFGSAVINLSAYETRRASFSVTVPDSKPDAIDAAIQSLRAALESAPGVLRAPAPEIVLTRAASSTADLRVIYWMPSESADARAAVFSHVLERMRAQIEGVEFSAQDATVAAV